MSSINILFVGTIAVSLSCPCLFAGSPAYAQNFQARVEKDSVHRIARPTGEVNPEANESFQVHLEKDSVYRITRPAPALSAQVGGQSTLLQAPALNAGLNENSFALGGDENRLGTGAQQNALPARIPRNNLTAFTVHYAAGLMPRFIREEEFQPLTSDLHAPPIQPPQQAIAVDYNAIERSYAMNVPPTPAPTSLARLFRINTDNCGCRTAIPSACCMAERTSAIYGASYSSPASMHAMFGGGFHGGFGGGGRGGGHR